MKLWQSPSESCIAYPATRNNSASDGLPNQICNLLRFELARYADAETHRGVAQVCGLP
jgi:hypothetical protein